MFSLSFLGKSTLASPRENQLPDTVYLETTTFWEPNGVMVSPVADFLEEWRVVYSIYGFLVVVWYSWLLISNKIFLDS